jgi:hypothetical protein
LNLKARQRLRIALLSSDYEVGRYDLHHAIVSQGGYLTVGHLLGRRPPKEGREPIIHSEQELIEEIAWFIQQQQQQQQPMEMQGQSVEAPNGATLHHELMAHPASDVDKDGVCCTSQEERMEDDDFDQYPFPEHDDGVYGTSFMMRGAERISPLAALQPSYPVTRTKSVMPTERQLLDADRADIISVSSDIISVSADIISVSSADLLVF